MRKTKDPIDPAVYAWGERRGDGQARSPARGETGSLRFFLTWSSTPARVDAGEGGGRGWSGGGGEVLEAEGGHGLGEGICLRWGGSVIGRKPAWDTFTW